LRITAPELLSIRRDGDTARLALRVPEELDYFRGHFEQVPLLPGVVQVDWAIRLARSHFELAPSFKRISALKFMHVIVPGAQLTLALAWQSDTGELAFRYESDAMLFSSGRILFGDA
jgi:3-hydroxymyristoyl/3-hydroxydecanoyl-(acyl carrier protein) dehydratase